MKSILSLVGAALLTTATHSMALTPQGQPEGTKASESVVITSEQVQWQAAPKFLPPGAQVAILQGNPEAFNEMLTLRLKVPAGYSVPPHWHPINEHVTVMSGAVEVGFGTTANFDDVQLLDEGGMFVTLAQDPHYIRAVEDTVLQLHAFGPLMITYVNPEDDPRNVD